MIEPADLRSLHRPPTTGLGRRLALPVAALSVVAVDPVAARESAIRIRRVDVDLSAAWQLAPGSRRSRQ